MRPFHLESKVPIFPQRVEFFYSKNKRRKYLVEKEDLKKAGQGVYAIIK